MKKLLLILILTTGLLSPKNVHAIYDPTSVPNNKFGIHILDTSEIQKTAPLINSSGGDWGYVTIPIQAGDKDIVKWQAFMDQAKTLHLIPIIRLATQGDYFNTTQWSQPTEADVLDFANFLNSLNWPTKNRYIIVFNEVNRADEWGGTVDPGGYAQLLSYSVTTFKSDSSDFFILSAGMDNAAVNDKTDMNEYDYFSAMNDAVPGIFGQIDGIASHSYPNPGFSMPSSFLNTKTIDTFYYEKKYLENLGSKTLPVFITETGWDSDKINKSQVGEYYKQAFSQVWNDPSVIAVTPFLLSAGAGPFSKFSFLNPDGSPNDVYNAYSSISKIKGSPLLAPSESLLPAQASIKIPVKNYSKDKLNISNNLREVENKIREFFTL